MTQFILKNDMDQSKIDILLSMIKSWDMEVEVNLSPAGRLASQSGFPAENRKRKENAALSLSVGMWEGRDINDRQLREKAWGTAKNINR
jgi:hypothetical protein